MSQRTKNKKGYGQQVAEKQPGGEPSPIIIQQLNVLPPDRRVKEMPDWKLAIQGVESITPQFSKICDLIADIELDPHVEAVTSKVKDAVTSANWQFVDRNGKPIDAINELINSIGFDEMLEGIVDGKFRHYSILEPSFYQNHDDSWEMSCHHVNMYHMRPNLGVVSYNKFGDDGIDIRSGKYLKTVMEVGKVGGLGLHMKAAPYVLIKKGDVGDWAMFVQTFGEPIIDAVWDGLDDTQRTALITAIKTRGAGGALVRPNGTDVTMLSPTGNANGDLQEKLMKACNREISKAYLGSTETTESSNSSGYAQSETHAGQDERKQGRYIAFAKKVLNARFTRILQSAGFDTAGGKFIVEGEDNELTKKESFEIHKQMAVELKVPIADDFFYDTYGVPKPDNYDELKAQQEAEREAITGNEDTEDDPPKDKGRKPKPKSGKRQGKEPSTNKDDEVELSDRSLLMRVLDFFQSAPIATVGASRTSGVTLTQIESPFEGGKGDVCCGAVIELSESEPDYTELFRQVQEAQGKGAIYPSLWELNAGALNSGFKLGWDAKPTIELMEMGFSYGVDDPNMLSAFEMNVFRFSGVKSAYEAAQINKLFRSSGSFTEFERMVRKLYGAQNRNHLMAEYNTAYAVGEGAATYYRLLGQIDTFPYWEYRTIGDERVRPHHDALNGKIFPANHPIWQTIFPPNDWQCRCYVVPRLAGEADVSKVAADVAFAEEYIETSPAWIKAKKNGWAINRADARLVFSEEQMYSTNSAKVLRQLEELTVTDWKMAKLAEARSQRSLLPVQAAIVQGVDYNGRKIAGYMSSAEWLAVRQPHEVWMRGGSWYYTRHEADATLQVQVDLIDNGLTYASSEYLLTDEARRGLLIKAQ
ncbi:MAG: DUF935 family protein [Cyclobacteriaceae bacterium]